MRIINKRLRSVGVIATLLTALISFTGCASGNTAVDKNTTQQVQGESKGDGSTSPASVNENSGVKGELKVHFLDVGQADSILIQQGEQSMLVDAGNNDDGNLVKDYLQKQGIKNLEFLVGTHPHEDHIGGLDYVINAFKVGKLYMPKASSNTKTFTDVVNAAKNKGLSFTAPNPGESFKLGEATVTILSPNGSGYEDLNNYSIVVKVAFGNTSFLLTGDAEDVSEKEIMAKGFDVSSTVLKVGHHGSNSSTTLEFLSKVNPKYAVISVGKDNTYGHPKQNILDRLKGKGIPVYRTDESGTIIATSNGTSVTFSAKPGTYNGFGNSTGSSDKSSYEEKEDSAVASTAAPAPSVKEESSVTTPASESSSSNRIVYWTPNGKSYHYDKNCSTLSRSKTINEGALSSTPKSDPCDKCVK
ncbi:competence protein ComEC [Clostridium punense]|uniref:Competence protein ComEC n=1 Tax=Clostridium punense TaxID=1054297 RepID=A0ABS4K7I0_9CLOT|nr:MULTISPECIES: ComEC/Rec2 family competence protein [Clostridium]EQB86208.1 competence protein [Clostridium sp. BL8]MBP2022579.1 competence protein ComEC [Clostridium punense]